MAFPGVCAIAADGIEAADTVKMVNAITAKVENIVREKHRIFAYLL